MTRFSLSFAGGKVTGMGRDIIGPFVFSGVYEEATGAVRLIKQYLGKHSVLYSGQPDGEGSIHGIWQIGDFGKGPFLIRPAMRKPVGDESIQEME
jgi:hypothetical protein